jgi:hypothetical protein
VKGDIWTRDFLGLSRVAWIVGTSVIQVDVLIHSMASTAFRKYVFTVVHPHEVEFTFVLILKKCRILPISRRISAQAASF